VRYGFAGAPGSIDIRETPTLRRGAWGVGAVHHLAWRVDDEAHQLAMRTRVEAAGRRPTPVIDRFWFKSVYFLEPGGVLFEMATDGPGFSVDEDPAHLGESLVLPPFLESRRAEIERSVPPLSAQSGPVAEKR
jgi:glyoxalase family protein